MLAMTDAPHLGAVVVVAGLVGLFVGSFLNVVAYRVPRRLSVAGPRSFCPTCRHQLTWWENVPVVSWIGLRGRCHRCGQPIALRYPLVESLTAVTFALVTWGWRGTLASAGYCVLVAAIIAIGLIEFGRTRAPLSVAATGTALALVLLLIASAWDDRWQLAVGSLLGTGLAAVVLAALRSLDPECLDPRAHGRSALLVAGCWCAGLGPVPVAVAVGAWIVTYLACMLGARSIAGRA